MHVFARLCLDTTFVATKKVVSLAYFENVAYSIMDIGEAIKQKKFDNSVEKAIVNLIYTHNWLRDGFNTILKPYGLLQQHFNVLRILRGKYPEVM